MTDLHRFLNALKILRAIDRHEFEAGGCPMTDGRWSTYLHDQMRFLIILPDAHQAAVWAIIEGRQPKAQIADLPGHDAVERAEANQAIWCEIAEERESLLQRAVKALELARRMLETLAKSGDGYHDTGFCTYSDGYALGRIDVASGANEAIATLDAIRQSDSSKD